MKDMREFQSRRSWIANIALNLIKTGNENLAWFLLAQNDMHCLVSANMAIGVE
jgi:hypothetical protein